MKGWIGVNQSSSIDETMEVAKKYLLEGHDVNIEIRHFVEGSEEHDPLEYEVYVYFEEE